MITPIPTTWEPNIWSAELRQAFRSSADLIRFLGLTDVATLEKPAFPVLVPRGFAGRMRHGDPADPLLSQVLAVPDELIDVPTFVNDPLAEADPELALSPAPGLIHKYQGRALMIAASGCAINCRYCFRRHFPYSDHRTQQHEQAVAQINRDASIREVILSGGDPLLLDDERLRDLIQRLEAIPHVQRLRIHTRIPCVLPERITAAFLDLLQDTSLGCVIVVHCNHPNELDSSTQRALSAIKQTSTWLLNQSVLLKGINDRADVLAELSEKLFIQGVQPYYLHLPDRVAGTAHFFVDEPQANRLHRQMQATLPGYLVPKLVREVPGMKSKQLVLS